MKKLIVLMIWFASVAVFAEPKSALLLVGNQSDDTLRLIPLGAEHSRLRHAVQCYQNHQSSLAPSAY